MRRLFAALLSSTVSFSGTLSAQAGRVAQSCVTVVDATDGRGISGARVAQTNAALASTSTDATGRGCFAGTDAVEVRVDAVGYMPVNLALGTVAAPQVRVLPLQDGQMPPEWASRQVVAALTQSVRTLEAVRDTDAAPLLASVLRRAESTPPSVTIQQDSAGMRLIGYVDLASDGSRYGEVRMLYSKARTIVLGLTTQHCSESCTRDRDVAVSWSARDGGGWVPDFAALQGVGGTVTRLALTTPAADTKAADAAPAPDVPMTRIRGVITGDKGRPLAGIEVFSADGAASAVTNERGEYLITMQLPPSGALLTTRRMGWQPAYRKVARQDGASVGWSPVLTSTAVLAKQIVRATGVPEELQTFRYNDFVERRARGVGQFFMTEEIWSAISLGDVLNRARGIRARFSYGNRIESIAVPSCTAAGQGGVAVVVNGYNQTNLVEQPLNNPRFTPQQAAQNANTAEAILMQFVTAAIVGMEIYIGHTQIPPELADPRYCAVISLWTR